MNDEDLVRLALTGDQDAYTQLYGRLQAIVRWVVYSHRRDLDEQDDYVHDVIAYIFERLAKFRFESAFMTWATRIAINQSLTDLRREKSTLRIPVSGLVYLDAEPEYEGIRRTEIADARVGCGHVDALNDVRLILSQLAPGYRRALESKYLLGRTHEEYREMTGTSIGNSKSQLSKALKKARQIAEVTV